MDTNAMTLLSADYHKVAKNAAIVVLFECTYKSKRKNKKIKKRRKKVATSRCSNHNPIIGISITELACINVTTLVFPYFQHHTLILVRICLLMKKGNVFFFFSLSILHPISQPDCNPYNGPWTRSSPRQIISFPSSIWDSTCFLLLKQFI